MSRYYYRQRKKAIRVAAAIAKIKARDAEITAAIKEVLANKDRYLSDEDLYMTKIPHCGCGTSFGGDYLFPAGTMLECWEHCPEFSMPDGFFICQWAGGLSGATTGLGYNPETDEVRDYHNDKTFPRWRVLLDVSQPYREKAISHLIHSNLKDKN